MQRSGSAACRARQHVALPQKNLQNKAPWLLARTHTTHSCSHRFLLFNAFFCPIRFCFLLVILGSVVSLNVTALAAGGDLSDGVFSKTAFGALSNLETLIMRDLGIDLDDFPEPPSTIRYLDLSGEPSSIRAVVY